MEASKRAQLYSRCTQLIRCLDYAYAGNGHVSGDEEAASVTRYGHLRYSSLRPDAALT